MSIISQSYQNWEIIFINDGSTDNTNKILFNILTFDSKTRIINKTNGGLSSARNAGITAATGDYVIFLDCDDILYSNCLQSLSALISNNDTNIIHYGYSHISNDGIQVLRNVLPNNDTLSLQPKIFHSNIGPVHSFCISKKLIEQVGYFDENLKSAEDWDFWIRTSTIHGAITPLNKVLAAYRNNANGMSHNGFNLYESYKAVLNKHNILDSNNFESLKHKLFLCLGVDIMHNRIDTALNLLKEECEKYNWKIKPDECNQLSTYLTFRYKTSLQDLDDIFNVYFPRFKLFFSQIFNNDIEISNALWHTFNKQIYLKRKKELGFFGLLSFKIKTSYYKWNKV